jgi:hypothetical protein
MPSGFYHRYATAIIVGTALLGPLAVYATLEALKTNSNDRHQWLPRSITESQEFNTFEERFGSQDVVILSYPGCTVDDPRLDAFAEGIVQPSERGPRLFDGVLSGRSLLRQMTSPPRNIPRAEALKRLEGVVVGPDLSTTCVIVRITDEGSKRGDVVLARIKQEARRHFAIPDQSLRLGGSVVDISATNHASNKLLYQYSLYSALICVAIAWFCLRDVRLVLMLFHTALLSAGVGMILFYFTGGVINILLMMLPALWFTLSVSGAVHFINYYRDAAKSDPVQAPERAFVRGWLPCTLATVTTAIGLSSLMVCDIVPVFLFGQYSALGLLAGLALLFLLLPSLLASWMPTQQATEVKAKSNKTGGAAPAGEAHDPLWRFWERVTSAISRGHVIVSLSFLVLTATVAFGLSRIGPSAKLKDYFPADSRIFRDYVWLEEHVAPLMPLEVALHFDNELKGMSLIDRMRLVSEVEGAIETIEFPETGRNAKCYSAATLIPDIPPPSGLNLFRRRILLNQLEQNRQDFLQAKYIREEPEQEIWRVTVRVSATGPLDYGHFAEQVQQKVSQVIEHHPELKQHLSATFTGPVVLVSRIQTQLWDVLTKSFVMAFGLIAVAMVIVLRSLPGGIVAMLPNVFPVVMCFGTMGWLGLSLDIGSLMTASVALGIAVDDTFHFLVWYQRGRRLGCSQRESVLHAYRHCGLAMTQTTLICGCGLLVFLLSEFSPAARFGGLMFAMLATALVGDMVFLPALLLGPAGKLFDSPLGFRSPGAAQKSKPEEGRAASASQPEASQRFGNPR